MLTTSVRAASTEWPREMAHANIPNAPGTNSPDEQDDVPRHDRRRIDGQAPPVAHDGGVRRDHVPDGVERLLRPTLLDEADDAVDERHQQDRRGIGPVTQERRG